MLAPLMETDRFIDRQRRAADVAGQPRRNARRGRLGDHGLFGRQRHRHSAHPVAANAVRPAPIFHDDDHRLHARVDDVRVVGIDRRADLHAHRARNLRRRFDRDGPGNAARYVHARRSRLEPRHLRRRHSGRPDSRTDARRLSHRRCVVAVDLLHQSRARRDLRRRGCDDAAQSDRSPTRPRRRERRCATCALTRLVTIRARGGGAARLVR